MIFVNWQLLMSRPLFYLWHSSFLLQTELQKATPATHVGIIFTMEPLFALSASALIQHEQPGKSERAGCILILAGMPLAERPR
ncbi:EamA family transporter [Sporolactobacillus sp. KGMB 08714]|uniref:EamA family transporter n=1 Tax=Sporolactobacillus sp. KGMB 08714 TaxID=3064704 RepID=UPI002FBDFB0D